MIQTFGFEEALRLMKRGYRVRRMGWAVNSCARIQVLLDGLGDEEEWNELTVASVMATDWHLVDSPAP